MGLSARWAGSQSHGAPHLAGVLRAWTGNLLQFDPTGSFGSGAGSVLLHHRPFVFLQNAAFLAWGADLRSARTSYSQSYFEIGEVTVSVVRVVAFAASMLLSGALLAFLHYTFMGKAMRAMVQNKEAAVLIGIPVGRTYAIAFALGIACVGAAGSILVPIFQIYPSIGLNFVLTAFVVVVLGGMGSVSGAVLGGLIVGLVEALSGYFIAPTVKEVVYYIIFLGILLVRPSGLFGILGSEEVGLRHEAACHCLFGGSRSGSRPATADRSAGLSKCI